MITRVLVSLFVLTTVCFAGGGSESLVAELNGWTLTLSSANGSSAYISKTAGDQKLHARIEFPYFGDYYLLAQTLPKTAKNRKSPFSIVEEMEHKKTVVYLEAETAKPLFELMLLNHRSAFSSREPAAVEEDLNKNPPVDQKLLPNGNFRFKVGALE